MYIHVIHVHSCHPCTFISFIYIHVIHVNSCHLLPFMLFMFLSSDFSENSVKRRGGGEICLLRPSAIASLSGRRQKRHLVPEMCTLRTDKPTESSCPIPNKEILHGDFSMRAQKLVYIPIYGMKFKSLKIDKSWFKS
jgi:hypothetical protein